MKSKKVKRPKETINPEWAAKLKEARLDMGLTQLEVSKRAKVSETFYATTERVAANPAASKLERMFKVLGIELKFIFKKNKS